MTPLEKVPVGQDAQKALLDDLIALRQKFLDAGVTVTPDDVAHWLEGIDAVDTLAKWRVYEKKSALLRIECMIAILRRL